MSVYVKRRGLPASGSIAEALDIFRSELRFYREIAPVVGVRVPACFEAKDTSEGTVLVLEDLAAWGPGTDPGAAAATLADLHRRWTGEAPARWPWLRPIGAAADLVADLYDRVWPTVAIRADISPAVRSLGERLVGAVTASESAIAGAGPLTLVHGDAALRNMRTGPASEVALLDWEDVSAAPGVLDLAWLLVSSVEPYRWDEVIAAYGPASRLSDVMPAVAVQGLLSFSDEPEGSLEALAWDARLSAAANRVDPAR